MKPAVLHILFVLMLLPLCGSAKQVLHINHPKKPWYGRHPAHIQDVHMQVWPAGAYARVELTMTMATTNAYPYAANDSLESVLEFELPDGSFIHNSWLWLSPSVIIQADIHERSKAVATYNSVVVRNVDPSLLQKTGAEQYQLNVFPVLTTYARKLRIFYATPLHWAGDKALFALPTGLLATAQTRPGFTLTVHEDAGMTSPSLPEAPAVVIPPGSGTVVVPSTAYDADRGLHVSWTANFSGGAMLAVQPDAAGSGGIYQMVVDPSAVGGPHPSRYLTVVFDHRAAATNASAYTVGAALDHLRAALLTQLAPTDSFAIFYVHNNALVQAGGLGWRPAQSDTVLAVMSSIPPSPTGDVGHVHNLITSAIVHAATKPSAQSAVLVFSNTTAYHQEWTASTYYNNILAAVGGSFANRIYVLNACTQTAWNGVTSAINGNPFWTRLTNASGGSCYNYTGSSAFYPSSGMFYNIYDFPVRTIVKGIVRRMGYSTSAYNVGLPLAGGFTFAQQDLNGADRWSVHAPYAVVGRYAGTMAAGAGVIVNYLSPGGLVADTVQVMAQSTSADTLMREAWTYNYITRLLATAGSSYASECIDSSIRARVLCPLTAFLALEDGDTVTTRLAGNSNTPVTVSVEESSAAYGDAWVEASPNPFTDAIAISFRTEPSLVEIFDAAGRLVWWRPATGKLLRWAGTDLTGRALPPGLYLVRATLPDRVATVKIQKR